MKKIVALVLALALCMGTLTAMAETFTVKAPVYDGTVVGCSVDANGRRHNSSSVKKVTKVNPKKTSVTTPEKGADREVKASLLKEITVDVRNLSGTQVSFPEAWELSMCSHVKGYVGIQSFDEGGRKAAKWDYLITFSSGLQMVLSSTSQGTWGLVRFLNEADQKAALAAGRAAEEARLNRIQQEQAQAAAAAEQAAAVAASATETADGGMVVTSTY